VVLVMFMMAVLWRQVVGDTRMMDRRRNFLSGREERKEGGSRGSDAGVSHGSGDFTLGRAPNTIRSKGWPAIPASNFSHASVRHKHLPRKLAWLQAGIPHPGPPLSSHAGFMTSKQPIIAFGYGVLILKIGRKVPNRCRSDHSHNDLSSHVKPSTEYHD
jgi:hypothetical protein